MRRLFWMVICFSVYVWVITSGKEQFVLDQGRLVFKAVAAWFSDAEVDFQLKPAKLAKKRSRRWD
jgi:hypothetical protein